MMPIREDRHKGSDKTVIRAVHRDEEGKKCIEKAEFKTRNIETIKYIERKLADKGVQRMDRHPADGLPLKREPKKGHGGKYTWEGPDNELEAAPPAIDEKDPNYLDDDEEIKEKKGEEDAEAVVIGEIEVAKVAVEGVARIEIDPRLKVE